MKDTAIITELNLKKCMLCNRVATKKVTVYYNSRLPTKVEAFSRSCSSHVEDIKKALLSRLN